MSVSATNPEALAVPPPAQSAVRRQMAAASGRIKRLKRIDRAAVAIITFGGIAVVLSVIGILVFIGVEAVPLFRGASAQLAGTIRLGGAAAQGSMERRALGSDEFGRYVYTVEPAGKVVFLNRGTGQPELEISPPALAGATVIASSRSMFGDFVASATADGRVVLLQVRFLPVHEDGAVSGVKVEVRERGVVALDPSGRVAERVSYLDEGDRKFVAGQVAESGVALWWLDESGAERRELVGLPDGQKVTAVRVGRTGTVIAGTDAGKVYHWVLGETATLTDVSSVSASPVTALAYLIGNHTFIAGTRDGTVSAWFRAPVVADDDLAMVRASEFAPQGSAVTAIAASTRDRTFATARANGPMLLRHQTSGRTLVSMPGTNAVQGLVLTPRATAAAWRGLGARSTDSRCSNPHPEHRCIRCSARSGTRATLSPNTSGSPLERPTTSSRS